MVSLFWFAVCRFVDGQCLAGAVWWCTVWWLVWKAGLARCALLPQPHRATVSEDASTFAHWILVDVDFELQHADPLVCDVVHDLHLVIERLADQGVLSLTLRLSGWSVGGSCPIPRINFSRARA